jgi:hypothetical protein
MKALSLLLISILITIGCSTFEKYESIYNTSWYSVAGEKYYEVYLFSDSSISFYEKPFGYSSVYSTEYIDKLFKISKLDVKHFV